MQRWIMAHPGVRDSYVNQNCEGYSGTYVNMFGDNVGSNHYDYRRVMDGVPIEEEDGFCLQYFHETLLQGDRELEYGEKMAIVKTWGVIDWMLENSQFDFTNPVGKVKRAQ
jgi:hypothetical protein